MNGPQFYLNAQILSLLLYILQQTPPFYLIPQPFLINAKTPEMSLML